MSIVDDGCWWREETDEKLILVTSASARASENLSKFNIETDLMSPWLEYIWKCKRIHLSRCCIVEVDEGLLSAAKSTKVSAVFKVYLGLNLAFTHLIYWNNTKVWSTYYFCPGNPSCTPAALDTLGFTTMYMWGHPNPLVYLRARLLPQVSLRMPFMQWVGCVN